MNDELNQRNTPKTDAQRTINNPVDELARIMGYNNDPASRVEPVIAETTPAADLEAELMREFGIDSLDIQPEAPAVPDADFQVPEQMMPEQETAEQAFPEQITPEIRSEQARFTREPMEQPNYQPVNAPDDVLAEMVQYNVPNPLERSAANIATPVSASVVSEPTVPDMVDARLGGDSFANDLEQELANLQHGLAGGLSGDLADGVDANEPVDPSPPVVTSNYTHEVHEPIVEPLAETIVEPVFEAPVSPEVFEPSAPTALDIENAVVDMSAVIESDNDVEQTVEFDIPSVEPAVVTVTSEAPFDADLDSELEREFSQMFSGETSHAEVSDPNATTSDDLAPATEQEIGSFFDMSAMNEDQPKVSPEADFSQEAEVAPMLLQPERIDVSQNQANWQDLQGAPVAGSSGTGKIAAVGLFAFLILGAGGYFIYNNLTSDGSGSGEPVLIKADNSSIKEAPADPGGTSVPNQDQAVYNQVEGNDTSIANQPSLVEATEEPVDIVQRTLDPSVLPLEGRDVTEKAEDRLASGDQNNVDIASGGAQPLIVPKKVRTVVVQADGTIITREDPVAVQPAQVETPQVEQTFSNQTPTSEAVTAPTQQEVAVVTDTALQSIANAVPESPTNTETAVVAPTPAPTIEPAPVATQPAVQAAVEPSVQPVSNFTGYYMQIASQPSLAAAQSSYENLLGRYNSVLGGRGVEYQKADIAGKGTFHRVRIQVGERSDANSLCSRYKSAGGSCFVTR